ncbi:unnamed protein product [Effrenium voratum]|uniref:MgtC/SapB/SrpB/YhiD N-terminal domain-containing protein n=1 Tax=Effrenium voratum TaxID=2562239 RepID=A0AA36J4Y4_9DINO|nr:unnamed protein product [Effrenium voratum]CAJ1439575.1 unnamed protein product [Effrenium voratum]
MPKHIFNPAAVSASGGKSTAFKSAVCLTVLFAAVAVVSLIVEPLYGPKLVEEFLKRTKDEESTEVPKVPNVLFRDDWKYRRHRFPELLLMTQLECEFTRRMMASLVVGALLGIERRESNRGAGVRTMSLVSLGACIFTIGSMYAFEEGSQTWDASRVSAALPSGVGFLGGALIFKDSGQIKGLTTACGVWLACAVGMCCGGGMYFVAFFGVAGVVAMLRFGPRSPMPDDEDNPFEEKAQLETQATHPELEQPLVRKRSSTNQSQKGKTLLSGDE